MEAAHEKLVRNLPDRKRGIDKLIELYKRDKKSVKELDEMVGKLYKRIHWNEAVVAEIDELLSERKKE